MDFNWNKVIPVDNIIQLPNINNNIVCKKQNVNGSNNDDEDIRYASQSDQTSAKNLVLHFMKPNGIIFGFHNVRSISKIHTDVNITMQTYNIDIYCIAETWLHSSFPTSLLQFNGYKIHRLDRPTHGGGVLILVNNKISSHIENTIMSPTIELLHVSLDIRSSLPIHVICIYKPPSIPAS